MLLFQKKGIVQQLIHNLKYKGHQEIGSFLGKWMGQELRECHHLEKIDIVIPVLLHSKKLKKRKHNQVTEFGKHIACAINAEFKDDILMRVSHRETQTLKNRLARWQEKQTVFKTRKEDELKNKHILWVDDIITTGASIEACVKALKAHSDCKISVASMAITI